MGAPMYGPCWRDGGAGVSGGASILHDERRNGRRAEGPEFHHDHATSISDGNGSWQR